MLGLQIRGMLPVIATADTWVSSPSPSNVGLAMPATRIGPVVGKIWPGILNAEGPLMVDSVHPMAWEVTDGDAAKAIPSRIREMRNFMLPPQFVGWRSASP